MINETLEAERAYHKGLSEEYYRGYRAAKDEIVHCDDCKYYGSRRWCELHSSVFDDNAFCSYGERER